MNDNPLLYVLTTTLINLSLTFNAIFRQASFNLSFPFLLLCWYTFLQLTLGVQFDGISCEDSILHY
jgi:hypothetical protein